MSISAPRSTPTGSCASIWPSIIRSLGTSIHDLDDNSLLHIFYLSQPNNFASDNFGRIQLIPSHERWWYNFAQVCRRWRHLILRSPSHLDLCLSCTPGTPVADMLENSPPFPLVIHYDDWYRDLASEDVEGILLALHHRDRVRRITLRLPVPSLQKLIVAIEDEFPVLEFLYITPPTTHDTHLALPVTFEAPHLRYLLLIHFASPIGFPLLSTAIGLVKLLIDWIHPSTYPHPNDFLQKLSLLPQLEDITISFRSAVPNRDIERQLLHNPVTMHVTHPNLRVFDFLGVSSFLESILSHVTTPHLTEFKVQFFNQLRFHVPCLPRLMMTAEIFRFSSVRFTFHCEAVVVFGNTDGSAGGDLELAVACRHLDWQVSSAAQISNALRPLFSEVVHLTLDHTKHTLSSERHNKTDRMHWRKLLGPFSNLKILCVHNDLVGEVSRSLTLDGKPPLEILPKLEELACPTKSINDKTFALFTHEREIAGQPVSLIGKKFPAGVYYYLFFSSTGNVYIEPEPEPEPPP